MKRFKKVLAVLGVMMLPLWLLAGNIERVVPGNWFTGMQYSNIELIVKGKNIGQAEVSAKYPGVTLTGTEKAPNPDFIYVHLQISPKAKPGIVPIVFKTGGQKETYEFRLSAKSQANTRVQGLSSADFIYLIMPDRFANGDPSNDIIPGTNQAAIRRDSMFQRHGGDLQGVLDHLDYLENLGVTALWLNPVQTNDQPHESYHGYAITNHYEIDPRLGDLALYKELVNELHRRKMKMVMDVVYNHCGNQHWLFKEMPDSAFFHWHDGFERTSYRAPTLFDPYASQADYKKFANGWFAPHMPDLDQTNPHVARFLIQNTIWWVETTGLDAYRIDTYAYSDQKFMRDLVSALQQEYPRLGIFGETWVHGTPTQAWFVEGDHQTESPLPGVTDFQLYYAVNDALNQPFGWTEGMNRLYYTLAKDYLYKDPAQNVVFLDNHDLSRFYSVVGEDDRKFRMGVGFLMTMRGVPMMYYGTEILMKNFADPDGKVREDFPGGWEGDEENKFEPKNLEGKEADAYQYVSRLANWRKSQPVVQSGALMQFIPDAGVYVYFRYDDTDAVMIILNQNEGTKTVDASRFAERLSGYGAAVDLVTGDRVKQLETFEVEGMGIRILDLE